MNSCNAADIMQYAHDS